jgi:hypothetical protein
MFPNDVTLEEEPEEVIDDENMTMEEEIRIAIQGVSNHKLVPQNDNNFKSLYKEMSAFEASKQRTGNLEKLYRAL